MSRPRNLVPLLEVPDHRSHTTVRLLRRLVLEQRIPYHKVASRVFLDLDDLDAYFEAGRVEPPEMATARRANRAVRLVTSTESRQATGGRKRAG